MKVTSSTENYFLLKLQYDQYVSSLARASSAKEICAQGLLNKNDAWHAGEEKYLIKVKKTSFTSAIILQYLLKRNLL